MTRTLRAVLVTGGVTAVACLAAVYLMALAQGTAVDGVALTIVAGITAVTMVGAAWRHRPGTEHRLGL
ncbi:hypothetical protein [Actinotalea sp. K2]|uniref:hypothetical protein n=1 Tax=Actinotalea sp. K2 TaxID=2939438 RepID=UPI002017C8B5|nr:hypothetical protein [Actinotalea sp. K2]MCL3861590.1 hypothetical protein [Actinotalea sp. K2]